MIETIQKSIMASIYSFAAIVMLFAFAQCVVPKILDQINDVLRRARKHGVIMVALVVVFFCEMVLMGGSKPTNAPPSMLQMVLGPITHGNQVSVATSRDRVEKWYRRGAWKDGYYIEFDDDWCFPYESDHLTSAEIWSQGAVYPTEKSAIPIRLLSVPLSLAPEETEVYYGRTTNNTYLVEWINAHPNREADQLSSAQIELFRNGDTRVTENGVSTHHAYEIPFEHDGIGQDEAWVRANFDNADEILQVGYADWVDDQIGIDLTNGLYKFTAYFPEDPPEATRLYVGDYTVAVTNAGEYVFILEKGPEYEFGTWPDNADVEYWAQDDIGYDAPLLMSWWYGGTAGEWTIDEGWNWLYYPYGIYPGYCGWLPKLQGSPGISHLGPGNISTTFEALLTDYCRTNSVSYRWSSSDSNIHFTTPNSRTTQITVDSMPSWQQTELLVEAVVNGNSLYLYLFLSYGQHETPPVSFSLDTPEIVFLNDDNRTSRWYKVAVNLSCPVETNAVVTITHSGNTGAKFSPNANGVPTQPLPKLQVHVSPGQPPTVYEFYFACTNIASGQFDAECSLPDGDVKYASGSYEVIEPLRKLVCTDQAPNNGYYNPSRLVYGTNAWLKVGVNGNFSPSDVVWRIVSGPGRITATNGWAVSVEPTANSGEVVVEAAFGSDSAIQPRFVLPITIQRVLQVKAFVVSSNSVSTADVKQRIEYANKIFSQVGVKLDLISVSNNVGLASDYVVSEYETITNSAGRVVKILSQQARRLMDTYSAGDCLELYFVNTITDGKAVAFRTPQGIIISNKATDHVLAHEIGHSFGLKDCYAYRWLTTGVIWIANWNNALDADFMSRYKDWGPETKRGFYERTDSRALCLYKFLMYGIDGKDGTDIPSADVLSLKKEATRSSETQRSLIGADYFKPNNNEVYSR